MTAGGLHLAILQERALRDQLVDDPNFSTWAEIYREKAKEYSSYAAPLPGKIVRDRAALITPVQFERRIRNVPRHGPIDESYWWWADRHPQGGGERRYPARTGCCTADPKTRAENDRRARYDGVIVPLTRGLSPVREIAREWERAGQQPLPRFWIPE